MVNVIAFVATALAIAFFVVALVTLSMERHVIAGTFFMFTAFSIYIREKNM